MDRSKLKIGLLLAGHVVVGFLLAWSAYTKGFAFPATIFSLDALLFSQIGLLAIWAGLGATRLSFRLPTAILMTACLCAVLLTALQLWSQRSEVVSVCVVVGLSAAGIVVVLSKLRFGHHHLSLVRSTATSPKEGFQFTLWHLLVATAVVALLLTNGREFSTYTNGARESLWMATFFVPCIILVELATLWGVLSVGSPAARLALVVPAAFVIGTIPFYYMVGTPGPSWIRFIILSVTFGFQVVITAASLLVVRSCGWRLVYAAGGSVPADESTAGFVEAASQDWLDMPRASNRSSFKKRVRIAAIVSFVAGDLTLLAWMRNRAAESLPAPTSMFESFDDRDDDVEVRRARKAALAAAFKSKSHSAAAELLAANGYGIGNVERIGHGGDARGVPTILHTARGDLAAIPLHMRMKLPRGMTDPRTAPWSEALFLFDQQGNLRYRLGGGMAADGVNGDMGWLLSLSEKDGLFFWAMRFEAFNGFKMVSEVYTLQPTVKRVLRVYHFPGDPTFPAQGLPEPANGPAGFGFRGRQSLVYADGIGADGREHPNWLIWNADEEAFTGATRLRFAGFPAFEVDVAQSPGFLPTDLEP